MHNHSTSKPSWLLAGGRALRFFVVGRLAELLFAVWPSRAGRPRATAPHDSVLEFWFYLQLVLGFMTSSSGGASCMVYLVSANKRFGERAVYAKHFKRYLQSSDLIDDAFTPHTLPHMHCVGLVKIVPGALCNNLFNEWSPAESLWWACLGFADDVASLKVDNVFKIDKPVPQSVIINSVQCQTHY